MLLEVVPPDGTAFVQAERGVYQLSKRWPEQVDAMQRWGVLLMAGMSDNVVPLHRATA